MDVGEVIVPVVFFALVFGIVYLAISARNKERMALIEKGADASIFYTGKKSGARKWILTLGIFAIGVALGVLTGNLLESSGMKEEVAYTGSIFLFGGAALVAAYFIGRKVNGEKE
jgi:hypothetical protein